MVASPFPYPIGQKPPWGRGCPMGIMRKPEKVRSYPQAAYLSQGYSRVLDRGYALNFVELRNDELRRIPIPRTPVNRGMFGVLPCSLRLSRTVHHGRVHFTYPRDAAQTFDQGEELLFPAAFAQDQLRVVLPSRRTRAHHNALQRHL